MGVEFRVERCPMTFTADDTPDVTGLIELARDPQLDLKPVILRVQTDLFLAAPIRDRATLAAFASLATGLIPIVDEAAVLAVARKLAPFADTPPAVLNALAARGGDACRTVIATAPVIDRTILEAAVASGTDVTGAVAERAAQERARAQDEREREGALTLEWALATARDPGAHIDRAALDRMLPLARADGDLSAALLARSDLAAGDLAPLWLRADVGRRAAIREAVAATAALRPLPPPPREIGPVLTTLSRAGDVKGFTMALSEALGLPAGFLTAAPDPVTRYDLITVALRAADLREAEAVYVFLTLNPSVARSADRVYELVKLYRSLTRPAARDLLAAVLDAPLPVRAGEHRPYYAADKARPAPERQERAPARAAAPARGRQVV